MFWPFPLNPDLGRIMYRKRHIYIVNIPRLVLRAHYYDSLISVIIRSKFKILLICAHFYMCTYFNVSPLINSRAEVELYTCLLKRRDFDGNDYMSSLLYFQICVFVPYHNDIIITYHYILYRSFLAICTCTLYYIYIYYMYTLYYIYILYNICTRKNGQKAA